MKALSELCHPCLITQAAERRWPAIGPCYCFMGADEREDGRGSIHLSDALVTGPSGREVDGWEEEECSGEKRQGTSRGGGRASAANKHIFMYSFRLRNALPPQVWLTVRRGASHFFPPHTSTHGLAMTFTSFEAKSGSRYSTLQWSDMLRCCHPAWQPQGEKERKKEGRGVSGTRFMLSGITTDSLCVFISRLSLARSHKLWEDSFDGATAALFDLRCFNPFKSQFGCKFNLEKLRNQNLAPYWIKAE